MGGGVGEGWTGIWCAKALTDGSGERCGFIIYTPITTRGKGRRAGGEGGRGRYKLMQEA